MRADPRKIEMWSKRDKCWMCKHRFDKSVILPVKRAERGKFQPNFNMKILFHLYETHGLPVDTVQDWIIGSIYGQELTEVGVDSNTAL